jgi:hypothetical protein
MSKELDAAGGLIGLRIRDRLKKEFVGAVLQSGATMEAKQ